jgi:hypothetical protein
MREFGGLAGFIFGPSRYDAADPRAQNPREGVVREAVNAPDNSSVAFSRNAALRHVGKMSMVGMIRAKCNPTAIGTLGRNGKRSQ